MANPFDEAEAELGQESANPFDQAIAEMSGTSPAQKPRKGYFRHLGEEAAAGTEEMSRAVKGVLPTEYALGSLRFLASPVRAAGLTLRDLIEGQLPKATTQAQTDINYLATEIPGLLAETVGPGLVGKAAGAVKPLINRAFPLRTEKIDTLQKALRAAESGIETGAEAETAGTLSLQDRIQVNLAKRRFGVEKTAETQRIKLAEESARRTEQEIAQAERLRRAGETDFLADIEAQRRAAEAKTGVTRAKTELEKTAPGAPTAEEAGGKVISEIYPAEYAAARAKFGPAYDDLIREGDTIESAAPTFVSQLKSTIGESGVVQGGGTKAQSIAAKTLKGLERKTAEGEPATAEAVVSALGGRRTNSLQLQDSIYERVKDKIQASSRGGGGPALSVDDLLKEAIDPTQPPKTVGDMIEGVLALRAGARGAIAGGNRNVARQFGEMEKALVADIEQAAPDIAANFNALTKSYGREYIPVFGEKAIPYNIVQKFREEPQKAVGLIIRPTSKAGHEVQAINQSWQLIKNPAEREAVTGAWLRTGIEESSVGGWKPNDFIKYWDNHLDSRNKNYVLRKAFGEQKFQSVNKFVDELRDAKPQNFDDVIGTTLRSLQNRTVAETIKIRTEGARTLEEALKPSEKLVSKVQTTEAERLGKVGTAVQSRLTKIESEKVDQLKQLRTQYETDVKKLNPKLISLKYGTWIGILGIGGSTAALFLAGPSAAAATAAGAGISWLSIRSAARIINTARGAQLMTRAARALPGTVEAISVAAQLAALAKALPKEKE